MSRKRYPPEQLIIMLRQAEVESSRREKVPQVCRSLGISETDLPPLAEGVRRSEGQSGHAPEGTGAGERPAEAGR